MFSRLISFITKEKRRKSRNCHESLDVSIAEEALEVMQDRSIHSTSCTTSETSYFPSALEKLTTTTLLQGSSDSKPATAEHLTAASAALNKVPKPTNDRTRIKSQSKLYPVLDVPKPINDQTRIKSQSRLYPALDVPALIVDQKIKQLKSIHDMVGEISCIINSRVRDAKKSSRRLETLKNETSGMINAILAMIVNPPILDHEFKRELEVKENSSDDVIASNYYEKIVAFDHLKIYRESIERKKKTMSRKIHNKNLIEKPLLFQKFSKVFKCYRGGANDLVYCP